MTEGFQPRGGDDHRLAISSEDRRDSGESRFYDTNLKTVAVVTCVDAVSLDWLDGSASYCGRVPSSKVNSEAL